MPLVLPNEGLADQLNYIIRQTISGVLPWELQLYSNDFDPDQGTVLSDLLEATFTGYSGVTMTRSDWTAPVISANKAVSTWGTDPTSWTCTAGGQTIYGYMAVDTALGVLRIVERFATPVVVGVGGIISVLPRYTFTTEVPCPPPPPPP